MVVCEKCQDRGFTELEHGLIRVFCDCEKGQALREEVTGVVNDSSSGIEQPDKLAINSPKPRKRKKRSVRNA